MVRVPLIFILTSLTVLCGTSGCSSPPPLVPPVEEARVVRAGNVLKLENLAVPSRGTWLYVLDPNTNYEPIGMIVVLDPTSATAGWFCPASPVLEERAEDGLPLGQLEPDKQWRVKDCGASFQDDPDACHQLPDAQCNVGLEYLRIDLGTRDGVLHDDAYRVYGQVMVDHATRAAFPEELGLCKVKYRSELYSYCELDSRNWRAYREKLHARQGFVVKEPAVPEVAQ